jgi:hypothetical protein
MALPMTSSRSRRRVNPPMGELVDLRELCSKLEGRLLQEEREISELRSRGEDTSSQEELWIRMLHRYERVYDLLASGTQSDPQPAA